MGTMSVKSCMLRFLKYLQRYRWGGKSVWTWFGCTLLATAAVLILFERLRVEAMLRSVAIVSPRLWISAAILVVVAILVHRSEEGVRYPKGRTRKR